MLRERQVEVQIPRGIRPGQHLRLAGMGNNDGNDGPPGDLYLEIVFRPHARYRIDGADLWCDLPLSPWEAALGGPVQVHTPEGEVSLNVPAGSRSGRKLRLKGRGLPVQNTSTGKQPGDLYAVLRIVCPPAHTEAERAAYGAFADAFASHPPSTSREGTPP
jgi:curved DNA-binding protein